MSADEVYKESNLLEGDLVSIEQSLEIWDMDLKQTFMTYRQESMINSK